MTGLNLREHGSQFLEGKLDLANYPLEVFLRRLHGSLPEASKVRSSLWNKLPFNILGREKVGDGILGSAVLEELEEILHFTCGTNESGPMVAPQEGRTTTTSDEPP